MISVAMSDDANDAGSSCAPLTLLAICNAANDGRYSAKMMSKPKNLLAIVQPIQQPQLPHSFCAKKSFAETPFLITQSVAIVPQFLHIFDALYVSLSSITFTS